MLATDVRFSSFAGGGPDMNTPSVALYNDVPSTDDNSGLIAAGGGAAWFHTGPYPQRRANAALRAPRSAERRHC